MVQNASDLKLEVVCDPSAPATVRSALRRHAGSEWIVGDLMLVASELVNNAVLHSGCDPDDVVSVEVHFDGRVASLSVLDPGTSRRAPAAIDSDHEIGGFGLFLVEQLALRWGSERVDGRGHRVWVDLELDHRLS